MEEFHQITIQEYLDWKEDLRRRLQEAANNFVGIGYRLKQIRDSEAYKQDGYSSIYEFAEKEYGISGSQSSRFMAINDKFSKNGNSLEMPEEFARLGSSKLSEMLTLPESDYQFIDESTTREQIRELKSFNKQEQEFMNPPEEKKKEPESVSKPPESVSDRQISASDRQIPALNSKEPQRTEETEDPLILVMVEYFRDKMRAFNKSLNAAGMDTEAFAKAMNPTGSALAKKGKYMLFLKKPGEKNMMKILGSDPVNYSWEDIKAAFTGEFMGKEWSDIFALAQMEEKEPEKEPEEAQPEPIPEEPEEKETESPEIGMNPPESGTDATEIESEHKENETVETVEDTDVIHVSKSINLIREETKQSVRELQRTLNLMGYLNGDTEAGRLDETIKDIQEQSVALLCNLQDWKKAKERK